MKKIPLIPADHWFFRNSLVVLKDPLAFFVKTFEEYGDFYDVNSNLYNIYVIANPDYIQDILVTQKKDYGKSTDYEVLKYSLGNGLLTSEGDFWKKQRRIAQPAFYKESMKYLFETMINSTQQTVQSFKNKKQIQLCDEMSFLTLDIVTKCLFGTAIQTDYKKIQEAVTIENEFISKKIMTPFSAPLWLPTANNKRYKKSRKFSSDILFGIINNRKKEDKPHHDLLSMLMETADEETGEKMSVQQLKDEVMTIFVAGHETTANALSWIFYLLSQNPDKMQLLQTEIDTVLKGEAPSFESLRSLPYTVMVIEEGMRLYPPAWSIGRQALQETTIDGYTIPKNARMLLDVYMLHRHPKYWKNPDLFEPERFSPEQKKNRHKYAYIPFGAGQRMCIGNNFAMMEMQIILVMILQNFKLKLAVDAPEVVPEPLVTLRPKNGMLFDVSLM